MQDQHSALHSETSVIGDWFLVQNSPSLELHDNAAQSSIVGYVSCPGMEQKTGKVKHSSVAMCLFLAGYQTWVATAGS